MKFVRLFAVARLVTLGAALWILALVFFSFAGIHIWTPPYLFLFFFGGIVAQLVLRLTIYLARRS